MVVTCCAQRQTTGCPASLSSMRVQCPIMLPPCETVADRQGDLYGVSATHTLCEQMRDDRTLSMCCNTASGCNHTNKAWSARRSGGQQQPLTCVPAGGTCSWPGNRCEACSRTQPGCARCMQHRLHVITGPSAAAIQHSTLLGALVAEVVEHAVLAAVREVCQAQLAHPLERPLPASLDATSAGTRSTPSR